MRRAALWMLLLVPMCGAADEIRFAYGAEYFHWEEFDGGGETLVEEEGVRHRFSMRANKRHAAKWLSEVDVHALFGTVQYDGWTQNTDGSTAEAMETETEYRGLGLEAGFHYYPGGAPEGASAKAGVRFAVGADRWVRSLQGRGGYDEDYLATYGRLAGIYSREGAWRLEAGAKLPFLVSELVDLSDYGFVEDASLNPKGQTSLYAAADFYLTERVGLTLRYDSYRFDRSDADVIYNTDGNYYSVYQPKSEMDTVSLNLGLLF